MGLDFVEFVMAIEEEFGVEIEGGEAEKLQTVTDITDYIYFRLKKRDKKEWKYDVAKKELSDVIKPFSRVPLSQLDANTQLKKIFPKKERITAWENIRIKLDVSQYHWPNLKRPFWLKIFSLGVVLAVLIGTSIYSAWILGIIAALISLIIMVLLSRKLKREFPDSVQTISDILEIYYKRPYKHGRLKYSTVMKKVKEITVQQLGVSEDLVTDDAHFVYDLGAD